MVCGCCTARALLGGTPAARGRHPLVATWLRSLRPACAVLAALPRRSPPVHGPPASRDMLGILRSRSQSALLRIDVNSRSVSQAPGQLQRVIWCSS